MLGKCCPQHSVCPSRVLGNCCPQHGLYLSCMLFVSSTVSWNAGVQAPASVTLPFGTFERVLAHESNQGVASAVAKAQKELVSGLMTACSIAC